MAELFMDNPFSSSHSSQYSKTVSDLKDCIEKIKEEFFDTKIPLNDDNQDLHRFCAKLEYLFQAGLKVKTGLLGGKKDYWNYICDCLSSNKSLNDGIRFVKSVNELKTSLGRGRALIRFALVHQRLADTVQQCTCDNRVTSDWYQPKSIWLNQGLASEIIGSLYDLNDLQFDLPIQGCDLDAAWPSFAKKPYGMHSLHPPSRTTSIGSLSSIPSSLPPQPSTTELDVQSQVDELEHEKLAAENKNQKLCQQVLSLESQKEDVENENKHLKNKLMELEVRSVDASNKTDGYDVLCEKLANELKLKEDLFSEKEKFLQKQLDESKTAIGYLEENLLSMTEEKNKVSQSSKIDMQEMKGKMVISETNKKTLTMDLQGTQKQLAARNKVDVAKTKLIDMQDRKISQQKEEVDKLQRRIEELLTSKTADVEKYVKASEELQIAKKDLSDREHAYECLLGSHKELKEMLHSIEKKSGDIGKIAKEKLTQYSKENKELKERVQQLECSVEQKEVSNEVSSKREAEVSKLNISLQDSLAKIEEKENALQACQNDLSTSQQEVKNLKDIIDSLKSGSGEKENELTEKLVKLQTDGAHLKRDLSDWKEKSESLEKLLEIKSKDWNVEKNTLLKEIELKSSELQNINTNLKEKIHILEQCEKQMEEEKHLLVQQLEGQTAEIELLKEELHGLSQLLRQNVVDEADGSSVNPYDQLKSVIEKNKILETSVDAMESRNEELFSNIRESEANFEKAKFELEKMKSERQSLEEKINVNESVISDFERLLHEKSTELETLVKTQSELETQIEELELQMKQSKSSFKELSDDSETKDKMIAAKEQQFEAVNEKVSLMQQLVEQLEEDKEKAESDSTLLRKDLESSQKKVSELLAEEENEKQTKDELQQKLNELMERNEKINSQLEQKDKYVHTKESDYTFILENKTKLEEQLVQNASSKKELEGELKTLRLSLSDSQRVVEDMTHTNQNNMKEFEVELTKLKEERSKLQETIMKQEKGKTDNLNEIQHLKDVKVKLASKIDKLECDCDSLLQNVNKFEKENETLSQCIKSLENDKASIECERDKLRSEMDAMKVELKETQSLQHTLITQVESTNSSMEEKDSILVELREKMEEMTQKMANLDQQIEKHQIEKETFLKKMDEVELEKVSLSENMNSSYFELKEKLGQMECENEKLREEIQTTVSEKEKMYSKMLEENECLQANVESVKGELNVKTEASHELQQQYKTLTEDIEAFQTTISEKDSFVSEVQNSKRTMEIEIEKLQHMIGEKDEDKNKEFEDLNQQLCDLKTKLTEKEGEISMLHETHEQELKAMQFQLSTEKMQNQQSLQEYKEKETNLQSMTDKITELECKVEDLQLTIQKQSEESKNTVKQHRKKVEEMEEKLLHKDNECQLMAEKVLQNNQAIECERGTFEKMQRERKESDTKMEGLSNTVSDIESENIQLKKKIIQLIREKDTLWKKSDKLQFKQKFMVSQMSGVWADSSQITNCTKCDVQFGFTVRKHHCRLCGQIFCYYCCNNWVMTSFSNKQERVCGECVMHQSHLESASEGEDTENEDDDSFIEQSVQIPALRSPKWKQKPDVDGQNECEEESGATGGIISVEANMEPLPQTDLISNEGNTENNTTDVDSKKMLNMTDEVKSVRLHKGAALKESSTSHSDEGYDLITTEEVEESSDDVIPDPDTDMTPLLKMDDFQDDVAVESAPDLWIKAGKAFSTSININQTGAVLTWEFTTYPKDINFSLRYGETEWLSTNNAETLIPMCKCNSHKKPINGELITRKPGIYTLVFDNKSSRFTSKKLSYKLNLKMQSADEEVT